jgi:ankyrin repeat protein/beta-lactamase regulating signal transducer with metallopeptidase domain
MQIYFEQITKYLFTQSWQIAILVVAIAAISFVLKNKSAHVRYLLWLIVLAKCLVPPLFAVPLAILPPEKAELLPLPMPTPSPIVINYPEPTTPRPELIATPVSPVTSQHRMQLSTYDVFALIWMTGAGIFLFIAIGKAVRTNHWLKGRRRNLPANSQSAIKSAIEEFGLKKYPRVWLVEGIGQPFVWGLFRGSIYLPAKFARNGSGTYRRDLLGHELCHILRFDAAANLLQVISQAIFWFHPFVWWANKKIRAEREKCCDEMAIARIGATPKDYSTAIVNILISEHESTRPVPSLAVAGPVKNIEERIKTMLRPGKKFYKRPSLLAAIIVLVLALLIVPTALVLTARAETKATSEQKSESAKTLHQAAADGNIEQVKSLISKGADVNAKDYRLGRIGMTPLHYAARGGHKDIVELLIAEGADVNAKDKENGITPVIVAMIGPDSNRKEIVQLLIENGAQVSSLHALAFLGNLHKVKTILKQSADINAKGYFDGTPLHFAVMGDQDEMVKFLIGQGADVNAKAEEGLTPLHAAMVFGDKDMVKLLIDKGADVKAAEKSGIGLLETLEMDIMRTLELLEPGRDEQEAMRLWWESKKDAVKPLVAMGGRIPARVVALGASMGLKDMIELAINAGADVNARAQLRQNKTLLHEAVDSGEKELVQYLLDRGADINAKDRRGWTPLHMAAHAGKMDIVQLLLAKGADPNIGDIRGGTALWYAKDRGHKEIVALLHSQGAKEQEPTISLHQAARDGDLEQVKSLISRGADVNTMDDRLVGTPLHLAAYYAHHDVVEFLISKGADINARNKWNRTAIDEAVDQGHDEIAELLRTHGAQSEPSAEASKAEPAKSLLESAASKYVIPKRNLEIPEPMQSCAANLRKIYEALKKYEKDKGTLPNWLSDLVPDYVSEETLLCPHNPVHTGRLRHDPRLPCSYGYEFRMDRARVNFRGSPLGGVTMRDWKTAEMRLFGDVLPLVRCYGHGPILNLTVSGKIYLSGLYWPSMFIRGYKQYEIFKLLEESSR